MGHFATVLKALRKLEKLRAFIGRFRGGLELFLSSESRVVGLHYGHNEATGSDFRSRPGRTGCRRGSPIRRKRRDIEDLMNIGLADVLVHSIVSNEPDWIPGAVAL